MIAIGSLLVLVGFFFVRWFGAPTSGNVRVNRYLGLKPNFFDYGGIIMLAVGIVLWCWGAFSWMWHHLP